MITELDIYLSLFLAFIILIFAIRLGLALYSNFLEQEKNVKKQREVIAYINKILTNSQEENNKLSAVNKNKRLAIEAARHRALELKRQREREAKKHNY